ncbi:MAG TPA: PAS domain-containing protein [Gammaproteobacteria bacterium]|nr:PAS domain-containing protein [Gammaproteobacteria bacterium]
MAALILAHDWSATPLGPIGGWPQSLRSIVDFVLDSPFPNLICWGPELTCIYNDAYRPLLGARHSVLGKPLLEAWPEAKHVIESLATKAWTGEASRFNQMEFVLTRNGQPERAWFTYAFSPLRDETGAIVGALNTGIEVTEAVRVEEGSQRRYDALLSSVADLAYVFGLDHRFTYANQATLAMWGKTSDEAIGKNCLELGYPEWHAAMHDREIDRVIEKKEPVKGEVPFTGACGRRVYEYIFVPILGPDGTVEAVGGTSRDVTERKRREERDNFLVALSDALRLIANSSDIIETASRMLGTHFGVGRCGYGEVDAAQECFTVRRDWTDGEMPSLVGTLRVDDFGTDVADEYRAGRTVRMNDAFRDSRSCGAEDAYADVGDVRSGIGVPLIKRGRLAAIFYLHLMTPRAWTDEEVALVEEVAERTWEAVERSRAERALRRGQELQRMTIEAGRIGTWDLNLDTQEVDLGPQMADLMGFGSSAMHVPAHRWQDAVFADDLHVMLASLKKSMQTREPFEMEFRIRRPDGAERWLYSRATIVADAFGILHGYGATIDITERKRAEADLEAASRAKDEFLAMLGHELRNPLAPIVTALQLMRMQNPDALVRERRIIETQVRHMTGLVDDLLDVSRITRGKITLKKVPIDIGEVVARAIETAEPLIEKHQQIVQKAIENHLTVDGDARRLVQVVTNLLTNAARYSPPQRTIRVTARAEGHDAVLRIRDEGYGIEPDLLPRIFDLFTQSAQSIERAEGGLGLGLALVKNLVNLHDGSVEVYSEGRDYGSEFIVRLPLLQKPFASESTADADSQTPAANKQPSGLKVLIVDDYADAAESLAELLKMDGYEVCVVYDGAAALEAAAEFQPAVALVDIGLPVMDGYEVARHLRSMPALKKLTLVALTGYGQENDRRRARDAGFDEHLVKPLDPMKIGELIEGFTKKQSLP